MIMFSIIIPAHNSEKFIERAILSILNQTYKNYEIILINDGSTDKTQFMCEKYICKNVKLINSVKNLGVSNARNLGIKNAIGDYILFLDSDDWLDNNTLFKLKENGINNDMLIYGTIYNRENQQTKQLLPITGEFSLKQLYSLMPTLLDVSILHWITNKAFKRSIINQFNLSFDITMNMGEDLLFCMQYLEKTENIKVLDEYLYYYDRTNDKSLTNSNIKTLPERTKKNTDNIEKFLDRNNINLNGFNIYKQNIYKYVETKIQKSVFSKNEKEELLRKNIVLNKN